MRSSLIASGALSAALSLLLALAAMPDAVAGDAWSEIRSTLYGDTSIGEGKGVVAIEAPDRAEDAAVVPVTVTLSAERGAGAKKLTLIVDENPAPIAAVISLGPGSGTGERRISTRLRLDRFTSVRAVAEFDDGSLYMASHFVKASGGCSAPASKDAEAALADLGRMQVSTFDTSASTATAQIAIRHPNFTGLQIDQVTRGYRPAHFIDRIEVRQADEMVVEIEGGIAISENPHFRFSYRPRESTPLDVRARDTEGGSFTGSSRRGAS